MGDAVLPELLCHGSPHSPQGLRQSLGRVAILCSTKSRRRLFCLQQRVRAADADVNTQSARKQPLSALSILYPSLPFVIERVRSMANKNSPKATRKEDARSQMSAPSRTKVTCHLAGLTYRLGWGAVRVSWQPAINSWTLCSSNIKLRFLRGLKFPSKPKAFENNSELLE